MFYDIVVNRGPCDFFSVSSTLAHVNHLVTANRVKDSIKNISHFFMKENKMHHFGSVDNVMLTAPTKECLQHSLISDI